MNVDSASILTSEEPDGFQADHSLFTNHKSLLKSVRGKLAPSNFSQDRGPLDDSSDRVLHLRTPEPKATGSKPVGRTRSFFLFSVVYEFLL